MIKILIFLFCFTISTFACQENFESKLDYDYEMYRDGPVLKVKNKGVVKKIEEVKKIVLGSYNIFNFNEYLGLTEEGRLEGEYNFINMKKEESQRVEMANAIISTEMDIICFQEIESLSAIKKFNEQYLNSSYFPLVILGNDSRGIQIGFLIKKDLPFNYELHSHRDTKHFHPTRKMKTTFSRDLPTLLVKDQNSNKVYMAILGTHFKSKRSQKSDPLSQKLRAKQAQTTVAIEKKFFRQYKNIPIFVMGDFNNDVMSSREFDVFRHEGFIDSFDIFFDVNVHDRVTHTFHSRKGTSFQQLDAIYLNRTAVSKDILLDSGIYRYKDINGTVKPIPSNFDERNLNPSDHFPIYVTIDMNKVLNL
ncbi:MAG: hypothetical protein H6622_09315 [Halobacteriovoraceae bacterium]|nr:hypothetical protein [Halobacteriovoraceae bacterium]